MTPLKEQTVYIPTDDEQGYYMHHPMKDIFLEEKQLICLSKEQLIETLNTFFYAGKEYERNIDRAREADKRGSFVPVKSKHASDLINELF